jgi:hypothetical protein
VVGQGGEQGEQVTYLGRSGGDRLGSDRGWSERTKRKSGGRGEERRRRRKEETRFTEGPELS